MRGSTFDLQFSLYDKSDDENEVSVKETISRISMVLFETKKFGVTTSLIAF